MRKNKMETKEELKKEYAKWTIKYVNAKNLIDDSLPSSEINGKLQSYLMTDLLNIHKSISSAIKRMETANTKMLEILEKLSQLK